MLRAVTLAEKLMWFHSQLQCSSKILKPFFDGFGKSKADGCSRSVWCKVKIEITVVEINATNREMSSGPQAKLIS